jgi:HK97 family phage major capsid protein
MDSDTLVLARLAADGGSDAAWKAENAAVTASDQTWERVELKAKTVVCEQILSREIFEDLSPAGAAAIENEIAKAIALKLDLAALEGSGTAPEPRGIANTTGVGSVDMGTDGLKPASFDHLVQAVFDCLKSNSEAPTAAVMHPRDAEIVALLKDSTGQPLRKPDALASLPFLYSSQIATDVTHGANDDTSSAYVGDFRSMIVGVRPSLNVRFQILSERFSDNLQVGILSWLRADIALARPADFAKVVGLRVA